MDKILSTALNWLRGMTKMNGEGSDLEKFIKVLMKAAYFILAALGLGQVSLWLKEGVSNDSGGRKGHHDERREYSDRRRNNNGGSRPKRK